MLEYRIRYVVLAVVVVLSVLSTASENTWRLDKSQDWKAVSADGNDKFLLAVAETKKLVNTGQTKAARRAFDALKKDFPEIAGPDLDNFIQAEMLFCQGKLSKAARSYDKLLTDYPSSDLCEAALDRQFAIAKAYLAGRKKTVLGFIKMKGYSEGIRIMEKIIDRVGLDTQMGINASFAVAKNYEERKKFNEAYLKWWEISLQWDTGPVGKDALLGMARCKRAVYNKHTEHKRSLYDASSLSTARSCYEKFKLLYPEDTEEIGVDAILKEIYEQLAYKQFSIGQYYQAVGDRQSANLYYDMVVNCKRKIKAYFENEERKP
ncbi:MAG: tetratricopeptide repeat protein [Planctomycetota bacterium]|jgi:tetratricopeptide (TPR) repeat protein